MHPEDEAFLRMAMIPGALERRGFVKKDGVFILMSSLPGSGFDLTLEISPDGKACGRTTDPDTGDEYAPLHAASPSGAFACAVQDEYRRLLDGIARECFRPRRFASDQGCRLQALLEKAFGDVPDNPFSDMEAGAFRTPQGKWYALVMAVPRSKLSKDGKSASGGGIVEIANLKTLPSEIPSLVTRDGIYPAWHMSKRHWISVTLDDTLKDDEVLELMSGSRALVMGKQMKRKSPKS